MCGRLHVPRRAHVLCNLTHRAVQACTLMRTRARTHTRRPIEEELTRSIQNYVRHVSTLNAKKREEMRILLPVRAAPLPLPLLTHPQPSGRQHALHTCTAPRPSNGPTCMPAPAMRHPRPAPAPYACRCTCGRAAWCSGTRWTSTWAPLPA